MNLNYLNTPIQTLVEPPIDTMYDVLPLEKLSWEDFEKLCLAVVQVDFTINDCEIFGVKGQAQEGIDIYARQANQRYSSYQCKRYQKFELADLNKAVSYFKEKKFFALSDKLYLCTSCEWNQTQVQEKFEELKTELEKDNIELIKWDKIKLSKTLKFYPQIVYDFFGLEWVKRFNGDIALKKISQSKKLDANQVNKYRSELYNFYSTIFNVQDPGIPIKELNAPYTIQDRFIIPDILSNVSDDNFENTKENFQNARLVSIDENDQDQLYYDDYWHGSSDNSLTFNRFNSRDLKDENSLEFRVKIDEALISNNRNIILGDPGAGKSTLLRYMVLDILNPNPQLENISQKYGKLLPVWLPFAFITKHLSQDDTLNISEILNLWFKGFGKQHLFEIAKEALEDERLFLVIDGIDEWNNISSAQQAITRIETVRGLYDCQIIYSSRPYGFRILKDFFTNLEVLNLAGFSDLQQKEFVEKWYGRWATLQKEIKDENFSKTQSDNFIKELDQTRELKKLAETPLLLSILIIQKMRDSILPKNKLEALKEITQYLINIHPQKRVNDAGIVQDKPADIDFKDIFCELAVYIQRESNDGVILKNDAKKIIEKYLITYANFDKARAKLRSEELINVGANNFGIIVEKSNDEISFSHKQFQEFLTAQYLLESDEELISEFITEYSASPTFHQVIINFFGLLPTRQVKKFKTCFEALKNAKHKIYQEDYLKLISYEVAINLENAPGDIINDSFDSIINDFEYETDDLYKEALLRRILDALQNGRLKDRVQDFLLRYFPNKSKYGDNRVSSLKYLDELNLQQIEFLKKAFINGTIEIRHDASYVFRKHIKNQYVYDFVSGIIQNCSNPMILGLAINSLTADEINKNDVEVLLNMIEVDDPLVKFFLYKYKVHINKHTEEDLDSILRITDIVPYQLNQEIIDLLIDGYDKNEHLKIILLKSTERERRFGKDEIIIDREIAWKLLFHCFNQSSEVVELVKKEFQEQEYPFISINTDQVIKYLIYYFRDNQDLIPVVDEWLSKKLDKHNFISNEVAFASVFVHNDNAMDKLFENLPMSGIPHWNIMALLDGWPENEEIIERLKNYFRTTDIKTTSIAAHFISKIFADEKDEGIKILEEIINNKELIFRERAIPALIELDKKYFEQNILESLLKQLESFSKDLFGHYYTALEEIIKNFSSNPLVQSYVSENLEKDELLFSLLIRYFPEQIGEDESQFKKSIPLSKELRLLIIEKINELGVLPVLIANSFSGFEEEMEEEVKADMAICLFNHLKKTEITKIIELSYPLVFIKGFESAIHRNIAFTGYLIAHKIEEYLSLEDNSKTKASPVGIFNDHNFDRNRSGLMLKSLVENFDYLISNTEEGFKPIIEERKSNKDIESVWSLFAKLSTKSSPSYPYLIKFITDNAETISNNSIISFLNRTSPSSSILKSILLRIIKDPLAKNKALAGKLLGTNFKNDEQVFEEVKKVENGYDTGRILALSYGWPNHSELKKLFSDLEKDNWPVDDYVGFNLKFLFRDVDNLMCFLDDIFKSNQDIAYYHRYFYIPMIERLARDKKFSLTIKEKLLSTQLIDEKISYYNLLSQVNMIDDDIRLWKSKIANFKNDYGYDIVSNKTVRLKHILYDYYY